MLKAKVTHQNSNDYTISLSDGIITEVVIQRPLQCFKDLHEKLIASDFMTNPIFPGQNVPDPSDLETYLNTWLPHYNENPHVTDALVKFMEDSACVSGVTQLQLNVLREKIFILANQNHQYERALSDMTNQNHQLSEMVSMLQTKLSGSSSSQDEDVSVRSGTFSSGPSSALRAVEPTTLLTPIGSLYNIGAELAKAKGVLDSPPGSSMPGRDLVLQFPISEPFLQDAVNADDESPRNLSAGGAKNIYTAAEMKYTADQLVQSCPESAQAHRFDEAVHEIVAAIQPHPSQVSYRASVIALIKRQVRSVLRVNAFECGLHVLRCFLPDDPTRLTVILGRSRVAQWHKTLLDRLTLLSEQPELSRADRTADEDFATDQDDEFPVYDHVLGKVQVASEDANFKIDCVVDSTEASISCNRRGDICMLAFIEEFAGLVGQNELFKRSLLLIRAWWFYETTAYGSSIRHYIPDGGMCIMVCAIFNQFHSCISSPLQALCLFLAEYSAYDGATHAITLQGLVPFPEGSQLVLLEPQESHLVTAAILDKYWVLFNIQEASTSAVHFNQSQQITDELNDDLSRNTFLTKGHKPHYQSVFHGVGNASQRAYTQGGSRFERSGFNVANPFVNANMVERLVTRRLQKVQRAFAAGAVQCLTAVRFNAGEESAAMHALFPVVFNRFGQGFVRPDRIREASPQYRHNSSSAYADNQLMVVQVERLMTHILYCNFVLESVLSDSALLLLCTEILKEKKVQPVGEVGKMLAEITSSPNLSAKLKEKFGGLKKFLEYFSSRFIFSNDHPFNPSVTLRTILDNMNLEPSDKGVQNLTNIYKARKSGSKRASPMPSPDTVYGSSSSSGASPQQQQYLNGQLLSPNTTPGAPPRSMSTYTLSPPGPASTSMSNVHFGARPELYAYNNNQPGGMDSRRKINAYGQQGGEQNWLSEQNRPRVMSGSGPVIAEYSPRMSIQRAQQSLLQSRTYPPSAAQNLNGQNQGQIQGQGQGQAQHEALLLHQQFGNAQRNPRQQQQQQQPPMPPPQQYHGGSPQMTYPANRPFNAGRPQPSAQTPMPFNPAYTTRSSAPQPPLYARQGLPQQQLQTSPQAQMRDLDALRVGMMSNGNGHLGGGVFGGGGGGGTLRTGVGGGNPLYQRPANVSVNGLLGGSGGSSGPQSHNNSLHSSSDDMSAYGDLFLNLREMNLTDFPGPGPGGGGGGDYMLSGAPSRESTPAILGAVSQGGGGGNAYSNAAISRPASRPTSLGKNVKLDDADQWY